LPWQLTSISLNTFEQHFPKVVPANTDASPPVYAGHQPFREYCLSRHAINGQGGKANLNQPQNTLEYRSAATVHAFIVDASRFRESRMPAHPDFSEETLDPYSTTYGMCARDLSTTSVLNAPSLSRSQSTDQPAINLAIQ
jgi:hypothetical protein